MIMKPRVRTIDRISAYARGWDLYFIHQEREYYQARYLMDLSPKCEAVDFTLSRWNTPAVRYRPQPLHILCVNVDSKNYRIIKGAGL
jgi:hypothetical protein